MKNKPLWQISVAANSEAEAAVAELLEAVLSQPAVSWTNAETGVVVVSVYLPTQPRSISSALAQGLAGLGQHGLKIGSGKVQVRKIRQEDWAESWKRHFQPIQIGSTLLVKPGWSKQRAKKNQAVVILDPGLSFGTGQHPTTAFCLQQVAFRRSRGRTQSFLDIGTGSGILAIAAAKLGYRPVEAFDFDPEAVRIASVNARKNRVFDRLRIREADLTRLPARRVRQYDLICANLISTLLVQEVVRILAYLKSGGTLVLAGILRTEFTKVQECYERAGLRLIKCRVDREWRSGAFVSPVH